jgi:hypothetical protein
MKINDYYRPDVDIQYFIKDCTSIY